MQYGSIQAEIFLLSPKAFPPFWQRSGGKQNPQLAVFFP